MRRQSACSVRHRGVFVGRYRWRMNEEGMVVVTEPPAYVDEVVHVLDFVGKRKMETIERDWGPLCRERGHDFGIPDGWLQAMIFRESGGDQSAYRREPPRKDGSVWTGVGLLQITHPALKAGRSDAEVFIPAVNIKIGAAFIGGLVQRYGKDFPKVAAAFNAGSLQETNANPWGMVSTGDHISVEVAALNTWVKMRAEEMGRTVSVNLISLVDLGREADDAARRDTEPVPPDDAA
jgi:hypothetical protein